MIFLVSFVYFLFATIIPRFIISVRELYDRDLRHLWQGVNTRFGVLSQSIMAFADVSGQDQVVEGNSEAIRLEVVGDGARQA